MASRHDIIHIDFQANAGKANVALQTLQREAEDARTKVESLRTQLQQARNANLPIADIQKLEKELATATKEHKQWQQALNNNMKGVRALDEAIKVFNNGKGTVESMNAALSKTALNAAKLQQKREDKNSQTWKEMDALIVALEQNIMKCNTSMNYLLSTIKNGGTASKSTLTQARSDLQQMIALENQGSNGWKKYTAQLKVVEGAINKITLEEQRMAGQNALAKVFSGQYIAKSTSEIEKLIAQVKQYQSIIADPEGKGARHLRATETALQKLSAQLGKTKGDIVTVQQALKVAGAANTANRFGSGIVEHGTRTIATYNKMRNTLRQLEQARANEAASIYASSDKLAKYDAQIASTTARLQRLREEMVRSVEANNLNTKQVAQSIQVLRQQQETVATGSPMWQKYEAAIASLENRMKIMKGEAMSLRDAMKVSGKAGGQGFTGTAQQLQLAQQAIEKAAAAAKKGSPEWQKYQQALAKVRVEMQNAGMTSERMRTILDRPANAKNLNELQAAVKRAKAELDLMAGTVGKNSKEYAQLASQTKKVEVQLKAMQAQSHGTASAFDKAWSRLKTYVGLYVGAAVAMQKIMAMFSDIMNLSDKMGEVRKTTGFTADEVGRLTTSLKKIDTRTSLVGLMDLAAAAGQLGLKTQEDVEGFTEAANKLMVALPEMGREGATEMLKVALATGEIDKIRKQMDQGLIDGSSATAVAMEKVGSTIDRLRATSAATAPAITDFVKRVGAIGAQSGITIDQVAALGSTVDALGMRVEMSATALSRMMPAIRNNAFDIAKILGVSPNSIRELYDTGQGMEVILMILQHIKDAGMDADSIEKMLGMGGMTDVMKELNQLGARAGIVFGGLSQNVDELRRQLGVAKQAYEENVAIQQEYDKMNETTAAKWARLKNQIEEAFLGDTSQRMLGRLIDALRGLVDLLTGKVGPALGWITVLLKTFITYWAVLKIGLGEALFVKSISGLSAMGDGLKKLITNTQHYIMYSKALRNAQIAEAAASTAAEKAIAAQSVATIKAKMAQEGLNKAMIANIWVAAVAAVLALGFALYNYIDSLREAGREAAKFQAELDKEMRTVNKLINSIGEARVKMEDANKEVSKARAELEAAKKANDGTTEAVNRLTKAEAELLTKEEAKKNAMAAHKQLIADFNTQYSKYLGFMLSEVSTNLELARARDLVNSKLRESLTLKRQEAAIERIEKEKGGDRDNAYGNLYDYVGKFTETKGGDITKRPRVMAAIVKAANSAKDRKAFEAQVVRIFKDNKIRYPKALLNQAVDYYDEVYNIRQAEENVIAQTKGEQAANRQQSQGELEQQVNASFQNYNNLLRNYKNSKGDDRARNAAAVLQQMDTLEEMKANASSYYDMTDSKEAAKYRKKFKHLNEWKGYDRNALLKEAGRYYTPRKTMEPGGGGGFTPSDTYTSSGGGGSIWGNDVDATSTDYGTWNVEELVARRKQMNKFKNVLKPGIDVRKVLAEDRALMKAIDEGKVGADWQSVLDWYNTERKKIQQELKSERFSTYEGYWRDEKTKTGRKRTNPLIESDYALAELDRYYSRRKEALEKARSEENISEELYNRQSEMLEQEHLERRSKLRGTFTGEVSKEEITAFRKWWAELEKMGELDHVPWATVESEWSKAIAAQIGRNNLKMQQDMTQVESITMKHVNQIAKIISKERPYDGITENLQSNLTKLDILFADLGLVTKDQLESGSLNEELISRLSFLLKETEHAYTLTAGQLMSDMGEEGFKAWADAIANAENADDLKQRLLAQLRTAYDAVQDAIKKEASLIKKQVEIQWNDAVMPDGRSRKQTFEKLLSDLGLAEDQVKRANQLIGAGQASERVADKLAIRQMQVRLSMQAEYFAMTRKIGEERIRQLETAGKLEDAEHLKKSLNLALSEEQKKLDEQRVAIQNQLEESQNRLYTALREWADLLSSSVQGLFEASHAGDAEYYNERAKLNLTGKGGPGAGTYVIIEDAGTSNATAHYEYLDERQALERQREIENQNAVADAWRKLMDDLNTKISEHITDWLNASLQNQSIDANTTAVNLDTEATKLNTQALQGLTGQLAQGIKIDTGAPIDYYTNDADAMPRAMRKRAGLPVDENPYDNTDDMSPFTKEGLAQRQEMAWAYGETFAQVNEGIVESSNKATDAITAHFQRQSQAATDTGKTMTTSTQSTFAKMAQAANMYGIAYQAMSNENLSATQKFEMMALQAVGNYAISALTTEMVAASAKAATDSPGVLGTLWKELGWAAAPVFAIFTGLLGGLMGLATSKIGKAKSQIAQVTGTSAGAGRLSTGMLTYGEGNVNEFTDPATLTQGRSYNVDGADGKTYHARYMGKGAKTHITNGPEFHLVGEAGREAIIDAKTTRQIQMDDPGIWRAIQILYRGGRVSDVRRRKGRGMAAFADGNVEDFEGMGGDGITAYGTGGAAGGMSPEQMMAFQQSLDRNSEVMERMLEQGVKAVVSPFGPDGIVNGYDKYKKEAQLYGEKYL